MTDRPIIFSAPMVRALLAGRKTQTRRLATSPLRRCEVGDRLYVREAWHAARSLDDTKPSLIPRDADIEHAATARSYAEIGLKGRLRPGMHMPRWASRLTLIVEGVQVGPLQAISDADAWAEGVCVAVEDQQRSKFGDCSDADRRAIVSQIVGGGAQAFHWLWDQLQDRDGERWDDNPEVVALTFRVVAGNIDQVAA